MGSRAPSCLVASMGSLIGETSQQPQDTAPLAAFLFSTLVIDNASRVDLATKFESEDGSLHSLVLKDAKHVLKVTVICDIL